MPITTRLFAALCAVITSWMLAGCATPPSPEQCLRTDWAELGQQAAWKGHGKNREEPQAIDCEQIGVMPDRAAWLRGWEQGWQAFCTSPARAQEFGASGGIYHAGHCTAAQEPQFLSWYNPARQQYLARKAVQEMQRKLDQRTSELNDVIREQALPQNQNPAAQRRLSAKLQMLQNDIHNLRLQMQTQLLMRTSPAY